MLDTERQRIFCAVASSKIAGRGKRAKNCAKSNRTNKVIGLECTFGPKTVENLTSSHAIRLQIL